MKRGTEAKVKFKMLERALRMETWQVKGLLTSIWDFAATNAPAGDIGIHSNEEIAIGIGFSGDIEPVIKAMVDTKWLDANEQHRLVIHHWAEHCEDSIHVSLVRRRLRFADGTIPKFTKLPKRERTSAQRDYKKQSDDTEPPQTAVSGSGAPTNRLPVPVPVPEPKPLPKPLPLPEPDCETGRPAAGVFKKVTSETLKDTKRLLSWYQFATSRANPVIEASEHNRLMVVCAAERALEQSKKPPALFAWLVSGGRWEYITHDHEERAAKRLREAQATGPPSELAKLVANALKPISA
jgi:hypothetical protein